MTGRETGWQIVAGIAIVPVLFTFVPMRQPTKLSDFPWVVVQLDCVLCDRKGCYRLARLAARYGPEQSLEGLLADLAHTCPWWRINPRRYEPRCGARFVDLERNLPPHDHPDGLVHRQREPSRESARAKAPTNTSPSYRAPMLSAWTGELVAVRCRRCGRSEKFEKVALVAVYQDISLASLLDHLKASCSRAGETRIYELCQLMFDMTGQQW